jgi:DNA adenine methylase
LEGGVDLAIQRILHYPGSKWSMADWIIGHMPEHSTYLEPFFGSGAVFFNKPRSKMETVNDIDGNVVNLFRMIRDRRDELIDSVVWTPYSREEYERSYLQSADELEKARRFLIRCWMARWVKTNKKTDWRHVVNWDTRPLSPATEWDKLPDKIEIVAKRLKGVQIENLDAIKLIKKYKHSNVLIYADPPYLLSTRLTTMYDHEMTDEDHTDLLQVLIDHPGPVLLSGYENDLYNDQLGGWKKEKMRSHAEAGQIREETLWINPVAAQEGFYQEQLF